MKKQGNKMTPAGDKFDHFLYNADRNINHYKSQIGLENPYNPMRLITEIKIQVMPDDYFDKLKTDMKREHNIIVDELFVTEGCEQDDFLVLGGKYQFLNHFCTFFDFNVCYASADKKVSDDA